METPVWRGQTMQDRALDRREQFVRAGIELLGTDGAAATTMRAVCRVADLSQKYFYETFANRDELLVAVHNRVIEGLCEAIGSAPQHGDLEQRTHAVFAVAAQYFEGDPRRARIAFRETLGDDTLRHNATVVVPAFVLFAAAHVGAGLQDQVSLGEGNLQLTISSLSGAFVMVYLDWLEGRLTATRDQIAAHCTTLVLNSLRVQHMPPTRSASN